MKRLAIIPARSGSKRLKNKNFKLLGGKPLINYTVENLIKSKLFETIHVSSDKKLKNILSKYKKIDYFLRPKNISGDKTILNKGNKMGLKRISKKKGKKFDVVCLAYATSPLISHKDFILACKSFEKTNLKIPMLSVAEFKPSIDEALKFKNNKLTPVYKNNFLKILKNTRNFTMILLLLFFSSKYFEKERREKKVFEI